MLTMAQVNCIREKFFLKGKKVSEIARETGHDVKTVKRFVDRECWNEELKPKTKRKSKLDPFKSDIDEWLRNDMRAKRKQRHTAKRIFERLKEKYEDGFDCSYRLVAGYVSSQRTEMYDAPNAYLPLEHISGEAQVDFGEADFYEDGIKYSGAYLNVSFPYSNAGYMQIFKGQNQECLFEGLKAIFQYIGGVPHRIWFDNFSVAVIKVLSNGERKLTDGFLRFKQHYGFEAAFCNPASGHEKGSVESKVGYHRRNLLVPVPEFKDIRDFNKELLEKCSTDMKRPHYRKQALISKLFEEDLKELIPLPSCEFEASKYIRVRTNSYAKFSLEGGKHTYSTAPRLANSEIAAKITAHEVVVLDEDHRVVKVHKRLYGETRQESMDWIPYLAQLARRPSALKYTGIHSMLPEPVRTFLDGCNRENKASALKVLARLTEESSFDNAAEAFKLALESNAEDTDSVIALFNRANSRTIEITGFKPPAHIPRIQEIKPNILKYDRLFLEGGVGI